MLCGAAGMTFELLLLVALLTAVCSHLGGSQDSGNCAMCARCNIIGAKLLLVDQGCVQLETLCCVATGPMMHSF